MIDVMPADQRLIYSSCRKVRREVALRLVGDLLRLDVRQHGEVVRGMRSVYGIDRW